MRGSRYLTDAELNVFTWITGNLPLPPCEELSDAELIMLTWGNPKAAQPLNDEWLKRFRAAAETKKKLKKFLELTVRIGKHLNKERGLDETGQRLTRHFS